MATAVKGKGVAASPAKKTTPVIKTATSQEVVVADDLAAALIENQGGGFEEATRDAFAIPFLRILQDLSPQVKSLKSEYIEGAKPGQLYNTVSKELFDANTLRIIPCHYTQCFIEWKPRDDKKGGGGGFVQRYDVADGAKKMLSAVRDGSNNVLPNGNLLMDTREHYVLMLREDGTAEGALIALQSTGLKVSRQWMSQMRAARIEVKGRLIEPPMYAWSYLLGVGEEANDQGQWYQWAFTDRERVTDIMLFNKARQFGLQMKAGHAKVDYNQGTSTDVPSDLRNEIDA